MNDESNRMTQMGLSNTGTEIIRVDSEILMDMSPTQAEGTFAGFSYTDTTTDLRYMNYNTRTSKLWNAFADQFSEEIKKAYVTLRNSGVYTYENIVKTIWADTDDIIGEIYFNKDGASKYLSQTTATNSTYLQMLHGNRAQKYKKFLKERLIFLDTIYEYAESTDQPDSLNSIIGLRSDAAYGQGEGTTVRCYLGISSYSPQYVTVSVGSGADAKITAYVGPESRYEDPDTGMEYEGTLFSFPIRGINKEFSISGAGNIKRINRLQSLNLTEARIEKATKILELDFSYSNRMAGVKVGNNTYLRSLNCANSYLLGTATESQTLDLSNCKNLKTVDISYTKFTGITFPQDTVLNSINLTGSSVKNISIDGAEFLDDIRITGCDNINKFELNRCNRIDSIDVSNSTIQQFIVTNCDNVTDVNLSGCKSIASFDVTNSYNIVTLNMSGNTSPVMKDLKLYSMYNLRKLIISQSSTVHTLRLPKYLNESEAFKASNGEPALLWDVLEYLDMSTSTIAKIQYGSADVEGVFLDMSQLNNLTTLKISNSSNFTEIRDIDFTGALNSLFYNCKKVAKISGTLTNSTANISNMFQQCYELTDIDGLTLNFTGVTSANGTCDRCYRMKTPMLKKILKACGVSLTSATSMCHMSSLEGYTGILGTDQDTTREIPSDLFATNTSLQNISSFFDITGYTTVPGDLFDPFAENLTNCNNTFGRMSNLTTVGPNLLHNKPKLTTVQTMFAADSNLTHFIDEFPNIFIGSPNITTTHGMFHGCSNLAVGEEGLGEMMYPLVNLTSCAYMFYGCSLNLNCEIPDGFLSKNTKLTKINGLFQRCRKLPILPRSLFRVNIGDTNKFPNLTKAVAVFAECNSMEGVVDSTFFLGAENLVNIGMDAEDNGYMSVDKYPSEGFFQATQITGYHETFLNVVPKIQNVSGLFRNCSQFKDCYYYQGAEITTRGNSISEDLFIKNTLITDLRHVFDGCSLLEGHIPHGLFDNSKKLIQSVSYMFANCSNLNGINIDASENEEPGTGISNQWFNGASSLTHVDRFLTGCSAFVAERIPEDLFSGCTKLQNTAYMFSNCKFIKGGVPLKLFDDCRETLTSTEGMFKYCEGLDEELPTGEYETVQGIIAYNLTTKGTEGALQVVEVMEDPFTQVAYADVVNLSPNLATIINASGNYYVTTEIGDTVKVVQLGLLSDCINLTSIAEMFRSCKKIPGAIPHDLLFTSTNASKFTKLTNVNHLFRRCDSMNKGYLEEETGISYLCSPALFEKCTALTSCAGIFYGMGKIPTNCQIHPMMFSKQTKVTTTSELFAHTPVTGAVSPLLFSNCINSLTDASKMFWGSKVTSIGTTFLNNGGKNTKLKRIFSIFQGCSNLEGTAPEFWNGAKFTAMGGGDQNGYAGALAGCTKLTNYSAAQAADESGAWVAQQAIYMGE